MSYLPRYYNKNKDGIHLAAVLLLVIPPLFFQLTKLPINLWDESRLAISAYEMYKTHNFLVVTFGFEPEMWSTKPPFLIWLQCICMHIFGVNEFAVRFPTAFAASGILIAMVLFSGRYLKSRLVGYISALVLITSWGFMEYHVARTGDYDVTLILFMVLSVFSIFNYIQTEGNKWLYCFFVSLTLAALTKGVAALLFLPGIGIYLILKKKHFTLLRNKHFYAGAFIFIFFVFGYYLLREQYNPGYIKAVMYNELGGRFLTTIGEHRHPFLYYFDNMVNFQFKHWFTFALCGGILTLSFINKKKSLLTEFSILLVLISFTFLFLISYGKTKLEWYNAPLYPLLAFLVTNLLIHLLEVLQNNIWVQQNLNLTVLPYAFLMFIFFMPYKEIWQKLNDKTYYGYNPANDETGIFLKDILHGTRQLKAEYIATDGYNPHIHFYIHALEEKGIHLKFIGWRNLKDGDTVLTHQPENKEYIHAKYNYEIIEEVGFVKLIKILGVKQDQNLSAVKQ